MNVPTLASIGSYIKEVDPEMFDQIAATIGSRRFAHIGSFVENCDPEMFDQIATTTKLEAGS